MLATLGNTTIELRQRRFQRNGGFAAGLGILCGAYIILHFKFFKQRFIFFQRQKDRNFFAACVHHELGMQIKHIHDPFLFSIFFRRPVNLTGILTHHAIMNLFALKYLFAFAVIALLALAACSVISPDVTPFYTPPDPLPAGAPGQIIKTEQVETNNPGVQAWRVMYHSRDLNGNDIAVTGLVAEPTTPPPPNGFPLLAIAHGTEGLARRCAPSLDVWGVPPAVADYVSFPDTIVVPFVQAGYAVAATDYQGLGAPGNSAFLIGSTEAQDVFDSIRAIRSFDQVKLSPQNFVWGHSQGGHSAAFVGQLAKKIAPEIHLDGIVLSAPAIELKQLVESVFIPNAPTPVTGVAAMVAASWSQSYHLKLDTVLTAQGIKQTPFLFQDCLFGAMAAFNSQPPHNYYFADPTTTSPWSDTMILNTAQAVLYPAPLFIAQGTADTIIAPKTTQDFAQNLCAAGNVVQFKFYPGADHLPLVHISQADVIAWLDARVRGAPAPSNCGAAP